MFWSVEKMWTLQLSYTISTFNGVYLASEAKNAIKAQITALQMG